MDKKKWTFKVYKFNEEKVLDSVETCSTRPMTLIEFRKVLAKDLKGRTNYCYQVLTKGFTP